jgi:hypothetical protein
VSWYNQEGATWGTYCQLNSELLSPTAADVWFGNALLQECESRLHH